MANYEDLGDTFLSDVLDGLKAKLIFGHDERRVKMGQQKKELELFEKKNENKAAKLKLINEQIKNVEKENVILQKRKKGAEKALKTQKRITKKKTHMAEAKLAVLNNKNNTLKKVKGTKTTTNKTKPKTKATKSSQKRKSLTTAEKKTKYQEILAKQKSAVPKRVCTKKFSDLPGMSSDSDESESDFEIDAKGRVIEPK